MRYTVRDDTGAVVGRTDTRCAALVRADYLTRTTRRLHTIDNEIDLRDGTRV
jgi:hypothetical protein